MLSRKLNNIIRYPEKIPADKRLHALLAVVQMSLMMMFTTNLYILIPSLVFVAYGIEFFQKWTKSGNFEHLDATAYIVGGLLVLAPYLIKGV